MTRSRGLVNNPAIRSVSDITDLAVWLEPRPETATLLMVEKRVAEVSAEHAESLAELRRPYSEFDYRLWSRRASEHRHDAAIAAFRLGGRWAQ